MHVAHCKRQLLSLPLFDQNQPPIKTFKKPPFFTYMLLLIFAVFTYFTKVSRRISCQFFDQFHCAQNFDQILIEIQASLLLHTVWVTRVLLKKLQGSKTLIFPKIFSLFT